LGIWVQGVISQKPGVGTIVLAGNPDMWSENPTPPMLSDSEATLELLETRKLLEVIIAKSVIEHITEKDLAIIKEDIERMKRAFLKKDHQKYLKSDLAFHYHIVSATHNRYLLNMFLTIRNLMEKFMNEAFQIFPELVERSFGYHQKIYDSLCASDEKKTIKFLLKHLEDIEAKLISYYESQAK
jgi:DNA-binding FadR family transcriptional regulator